MLTQEKINGWYDHKSNKEKTIESYDCEICQDTGEVSCDGRDKDGNWERGTETQMCECRLDNEIDMSGADGSDER